MESLRDTRTLAIIHFNDSYNIEPMKEEPIGGIARFQTALKSFEKLDPIVLFSGDLFSPSNRKYPVPVLCANILNSWHCLQRQADD